MRSPTLIAFVAWMTASALVVLGNSCKKKSVSFTKDDIQYFQENLQFDMKYSELVAKFGEPTDLNAAFAGQDGLHIYQYTLADSTFVRIGYTDKIVYACVVDDGSNLIEDLIVASGNGD